MSYCLFFYFEKFETALFVDSAVLLLVFPFFFRDLYGMLYDIVLHDVRYTLDDDDSVLHEVRYKKSLHS